MTPLAAPPEEPLVAGLGSRFVRHPVAVSTAFILIVIVGLGILAPLIAPADPNAVDVRSFTLPPGAEGHLLGTDGSGRDVLSRWIYAAGFSMLGAAVAVLVAAALGIPAGLVAGYFGGVLERAFTWLTSLLMALPAIIVLLAARAVLGPSLWLTMALFGVLLTPGFFQVTHSTVRAIRSEPYIDAARVGGLGTWRIIGRHVLPVIAGTLAIQTALLLCIAIAVQAGLDFLGLGDTSIPTWGSMLNDGFTNLYTAPTLVVWPALAMIVASICLVLLASSLSDLLARSTESPTASARRVRRVDRSVAAAPAGGSRSGPPAPVPSAPLLDITGLSIAYPNADGGLRTVVRDVSLRVAPGEIHGLVGESGSGKTQTAWSVLKLLPGSARVVGGSVLFRGRNVLDLSERDARSLRGSGTAYVPQDPMTGLDPSLTIGHQLTEPLRVIESLSRAQATARAVELLGQVGIADADRVLRSYPHQVSGGMAQRVLIASAVARRPELLIADEPTTALDVTVQAEILDLLRRLRDETGMGILLVTHNLGVVADVCDRVTVMRQGEVFETGAVTSVFAHPAHPYTRLLLDAAQQLRLGTEPVQTNGRSL